MFVHRRLRLPTFAVLSPLSSFSAARAAGLPALLCLACLQLWSAGASAAAEGVPVAVATIKQQSIYRQVEITGTVTSPRVAQLSTATSGLVVAIHAEEGDQVEQGSLLLELDPELAQLTLQATQARRQQTQLALQDAERRLREARVLLPQRSIAESTVRDLEAEVAEDRASFEQARAEASHQQQLVARHQLKAPFHGVVSKKLAELGEWVVPGQGVFELVADQHLRLDFAVGEDYLAALDSDTEVQYSLNALPGQRFQGRVQTIVPVTEPGARTFLLRVQPESQNERLIPGMSARATLQIPTSRTGLAVPRDATLRYPDGRVVVWTVSSGKDGPVASEKLVQIGQSFDGMVEIRQGLKADDRVVVKGNEALQNGQRLRIIDG